MHRVSGTVHAHLAAFLCLVLASPSAAQDKPAKPDKPPTTATGKDTARAAYGRGVEAYSSEDYALAQEQFGLAEEAFPSPNIELMLGRSLMKLGRWLEACRVLTRAQAGATTPKYANTAKLAAAELALAQRQLAQLEIEITNRQGDEQLSINGEQIEAAAWQSPLALDPGPVRVELARPGGQKVMKQLVLGPGDQQHVALSLPAVEPSSAPNASAGAATNATEPLPPAPQSAPKPRESSSPWLQGLSYALVGVGVAGFAGFAGFGVYSHDHYEKLEELCPNHDGCHPSYRWLATKGQTYQTLANVSLVAGSVALAAGVTLWVVTLSPGRAEVEMTSNSVRIRGSF